MRCVLDPPVLRQTGAALRVDAVEFANANAHSDVAAAAVGHDELADRVRDFARLWDDRLATLLRRRSVERLGPPATPAGAAP